MIMARQCCVCASINRQRSHHHKVLSNALSKGKKGSDSVLEAAVRAKQLVVLHSMVASPSWLRRLRAIFTDRYKIFRSHFKLQRGNLAPIDLKNVEAVEIAIKPRWDRGRVVKARQHDLRE